jgi:hypothetical protein
MNTEVSRSPYERILPAILSGASIIMLVWQLIEKGIPEHGTPSYRIAFYPLCLGLALLTGSDLPSSKSAERAMFRASIVMVSIAAGILFFTQ